MSSAKSSKKKDPSAEEVQIDPGLASLAGLEKRIVVRKLAELKVLDPTENARFMVARDFNQLVENLARDKVLTSVPLIYKDEILSGNHRVQAAIKAGIVEAECMEILTELSPSRKRAIQLSHNAIVGKDDPSLLAHLYANLDFSEKSYSGITEDMLGGAKDIDLAALSVGSMQTQEVMLTFLPEQAEAFTKLLKEVQAKAKKQRTVIAVGSLDTFDELFDTLLRVKETANVLNTASAFAMMAKLCNERLDQMVAERDVQAAAAAAVAAGGPLTPEEAWPKEEAPSPATDAGEAAAPAPAAAE